MTLDEPITLNEAVRRLADVGMTYQTTRHRVIEGRIRGEKVGGRWFVDARSVEAFREARLADRADA